MEKITGPVAAIIVSLILGLSILVSSGALVPEKDTYATVNFDGGYKKIGVISSERVFFNVKVFDAQGESAYEGTAEQTISWLKSGAKSKNLTTDKFIMANDWSFEGSGGISWVGSESSFDLTTDSFEITVTSDNKFNMSEIIKRIEEVNQKVNDERQINSQNALVFGPAPSQSFLLTKVLNLLK